MTILSGPAAAPYGVVYLITNTVNGKQYVGQTTVGIAARWERHVKSSRAAKRDQPISAAIRRYGRNAFEVVALQECNQESLNAAELAEVDRLDTFAPNGYNLRAGGGGKGRLAPELRARLSRDFPRNSASGSGWHTRVGGGPNSHTNAREKRTPSRCTCTTLLASCSTSRTRAGT